MAALEAKCQQYERDLDHLKRALERSDQYIDDLESRSGKPEKSHLELQEGCGSSKDVAGALTQQQKINMMMRSLSDDERRSICSNPEAECQTLLRNPSSVFVSSTDHKEFNKNITREQKKEDSESSSSDVLPTTPSTAFQSLTLRSPGIREKKVAFKTVSYLRKLDFEERHSPGKTNNALENKFRSLEKFPNGLHSNDSDSSKSTLWGCWQRSNSNDSSHPGPSKERSCKGSTSANLVSDQSDNFQMSSEASMDAAYLDKISELDSMMLDGESSSSRGSQLSASSPSIDLDNTLVPENQTSSDVLSGPGGKPVIQGEHKTQYLCDSKDGTLNVKEALENSSGEGCAAQELGSQDSSHVSGCAEHTWPSQTDELSFDLLFDPLDEIKAGPSGSLSPVSQQCGHDHVNPSSSFSGCTAGKPVNTSRDKQALSSQPTKRKSHSPFNTSSPTKFSKLM